MKITQNKDSQNLVLNVELDFNPDAGREESLVQFEEETLRSIINPIENYETVRYIHKSYSGVTGNVNNTQCDLWFNFYFYNNLNPQTHIGGLDYSLTGISPQENAKMLRQSTESFFRLEFYKVPMGEQPDRSNRRLVFTKNLTIPLGERVFYTPMNDYIHVPVFIGSNYRNKENMYLFWFQDDSALKETILTGNTFYVTARFFNALDGSILNFGNKSKSITSPVNEIEDVYYKLEIDKTDYSYEYFTYTGSSYYSTNIGRSGNPIKFYEISGG